MTASQAITVQNTTQQSRSFLVALQKTRARMKITASISSPASAQNKPTRPRNFHRVLFKTVLSILLDSRMLILSSEVFCKTRKTLFAKFHVCRLSFFQRHEVRQMEKLLIYICLPAYLSIKQSPRFVFVCPWIVFLAPKEIKHHFNTAGLSQFNIAAVLNSTDML